MENINKTPATPESVWEIVRELSLSIDKSRVEFEKEKAESLARSEKEKAESLARSEKEKAEARAEFDRGLNESRLRFEKEMAESREEFKQRMKNLDEMIGGMANSNGMVAEELFYNAIENGDKNFFGEQFDKCHRYARSYDKGKKKKIEIDIVLVNGKSVAIVEVKYRARREDIQKTIDKIPDFKTLFPQYQSHKIYLGLAAMAFDNGVEEESVKEGIVLFKQVGDTVVINDEHLKVF